MLNLPGGESDLSHRLPVIMITFDHIFLDLDHRCLLMRASVTAKSLSHGSQRIFPSQLFAKHLQRPLIDIGKQP